MFTSMSSIRPVHLFAGVACALVAIASWQILVVRGDLRLLAVLGGAALLTALCLNRPRLTILLTMAWLPFLGFIRRLFDPGGMPATDPFLMVVPIVTSVLLIGTFWSFRENLGDSLSRSRVTLLVTILVLVLVAGVFNPVQGSPLIGLGGTVFLFFPVLWFYLGRAYLDDEMVERLLWVVIWTGAVCALYGIVQAITGFSGAEAHWIASRNFASLQIGRFIRPFSTFPSPEEWSRYTAVAATAAVGVAFGRRDRWWLLALTPLFIGALLLCGVRISIFGLLLSVAVLLMVTTVSRVRALLALLGLGLLLMFFVWLVPATTVAEEYASDVAWDAFFGHATRGIVAPLSEDTMWARFDIWWNLATNVVPKHPLGMGLGVPTLGAWKFDSQAIVGTESYAGAVFVATGFIGGALLLASFAAVLVRAARLCRHPSKPVIHIVSSLVWGIIFTSVVGNSLSLYTVGPLGWALIGWLSARERG
jgi:hypothetical protein